MSEKKPTVRREVKVAIAYPPFVKLLPPEVGQRKAANRARGRAIFAAVIALGVAILVSAGANLVALQRVLALETARATTLSLTQQQGEYNEVRTADQLLKTTTSARIFATSTEVSVRDIVAALGSKLSGSLAIANYNFETATPLLSFGAAASPLDPDRMAQFTMEITGTSIAEIDGWVREAPSVNGVLDVSLVSVKQEEGVYSAQVTVFIGADALLHRFDDFVVEEEAATESTTAPAPTDTPVPSDGSTDEENGS